MNKIVVFLFIGCFNLFAQKQEPLSKILNKIEITFDVRFSYADETIEGIKVSTPDLSLTLEETLLFIEERSNLKFQLLNKRYISIVKDNSEDIFSQLQELDEIIIDNYITTGITKNKNGITSIKSRKFDILPGLIEPDVLQIAQVFPGVLSVDERISNINVRGGTHDQNLILWDGVRMYQSGHFFGLISAFNPYLTETVALSKNGTSAKFGGGISSVINMKLPDNIENEFAAGAGLNLINGDVFIKTPINKKLNLNLSVRRSVNDFIDTPTYNQYFKRIFQDTDLTDNDNIITKNEKFYFYDFTTKLMYDINRRNKLRVQIFNSSNKLRYAEEFSTENQIFAQEKTESKLEQRNLVFGLDYYKYWTNRTVTFVNAYFSNYNLDATNTDIINEQRLIQKNEVLDQGIKINTTHTLNTLFDIDFGYQFSEIGIGNLEDVTNPDFSRYIKEVIRVHAIYAESQFESTNKQTTVRFGLRTNYIEKFSKTIIEPRFSLNHSFLNNFKLELLGEFKHQVTSQIIDLQKDFLGIEKRRWVLANNTTIPITKSKQVSLGLNYKKRNLLVSLEFYLKNVNGITSRSQGFQNQFQLVNDIGSYTIKGADFILNKEYKRINSWLSYSYNDNNYTFNTINGGNSFPNNFNITHAVKFGTAYKIKGLKVAFGLNWHSGRPITTPNENGNFLNESIIYNAPNNENLSDYMRVNISSIYNFNLSKNTRAVVGASVWNLLNRKNVINAYYRLDSGTVDRVEIISLGLTPNLSFRVEF